MSGKTTTSQQFFIKKKIKT